MTLTLILLLQAITFVLVLRLRLAYRADMPEVERRLARLLEQHEAAEATDRARREMWTQLASGAGRERLRERLTQRLREGTGKHG